MNATISITMRDHRPALARLRVGAGLLCILHLGCVLHAASPAVTAAEPPAAGPDGWYSIQPGQGRAGPDLLSLADWLDAPAGRHGRIRAEGDRLVLAGHPIKLWGINLSYAACAPTKALAEKRADFYARHGINAIRLHKFADGPGWAGIQGPDSFLDFDPEALDRFDYFVAALKRRGIYVKLSPTFHVKPGPADLAAIPYAAELTSEPLPAGKRLPRQSGAVFLSREYQDLQIEQTCRLLQHRNPYTGLTYAEDAAVAFVELYNEDSALWFGTQRVLAAVPTLRRRAAAAFSAWLQERYGDEAGLLAAWGPDALNAFANEGFSGESLTDRSIVPVGSPALFDTDQIDGPLAHLRQRLIDTMLFLTSLQDGFYDRFAAAISATGYGGELVASNWQAGRGPAHYLNLRSDARFGTVDRHNYFNGPDRTMVAVPGGGILGSGQMQVAGHPFMLSEWIHVHPNPYGAEGVAIVGTYGMGLQGWDASFIFQNRDPGGYVPAIEEKWEAATPQIIGLFPGFARQIHRGDVTMAPLTATRRVAPAALERGVLDFRDTIQQRGDIKTFDADEMPAATLAIARTLVDLEAPPESRTEPFDPGNHRDADGTLVSSTGQLRWHPGAHPLDGWLTIDTPASQALVGFAPAETIQLADAAITARAGTFAVIHLTARERDATLATSRCVLASLIGRVRNTGEQIGADGKLGVKGGPPLQLEAIRATLHLKRGDFLGAEPLDRDGRPSGHLIPAEDGAVALDTGRDRTPWYGLHFRGANTAAGQTGAEEPSTPTGATSPRGTHP